MYYSFTSELGVKMYFCLQMRFMEVLSCMEAILKLPSHEGEKSSLEVIGSTSAMPGDRIRTISI